MGGSSSSTAIDHSCKDLKARYDQCHNSWYKEEFLTGKSMAPPPKCRALWDTYTSCVKKNISAKYNVKFEEEDDYDEDDVQEHTTKTATVIKTTKS
mmetsp:Transcript_27971/g.38665  ORF Transcript_27971/g.38665 Transcript_27971/m.38665 type:complete len:96 (+) Transcript_27971:1-288(+)|eukprot:jgi/Bigna1/141972/aug1.66_g16680